MNITAIAKSDGSVDLTGKQGATWGLTVTAYQDTAKTLPFDLAGKSARGMIRKDYTSVAATASFTCTIPAYTTGAIALTISSATSSFNRATGSFITDGFNVEDGVMCNSVTGNNANIYIISVLTATKMTLVTPLRATPVLTNETGTLTVTNAGTVRIALAASASAAIACGKLPSDTASSYVYDIETYSGSPEVVDRLLEGKLFVDAEVTK